MLPKMSWEHEIAMEQKTREKGAFGAIPPEAGVYSSPGYVNGTDSVIIQCSVPWTLGGDTSMRHVWQNQVRF